MALLTLHHGHTGRTLALDPTRTSTLDALRALIATHYAILPTRQVLLTAKGKSVRPQSLLTEPELFVFDASLLSSANASTGSLRGGGNAVAGESGALQNGKGGGVYLDLPDEVDASAAPDTITRQDELGSWKELFRARLGWAREVAGRCEGVARVADEAEVERAVIARGLGVALESLRIHIRGAEGKLEVAGRWVEEVVREQARRLEGWEGDWGVLRDVRARGDFAGFVQGVGAGEARTLGGMLGRARVEGAAKRAEQVLVGIKRRVEGVRTALDEAIRQSDELVAAAEQMQSQSSMEASAEPGKLMEEIEIILRKIASDDNHVSTLPKTTQSVSQASKMALLHTRNYLPNLQEYAAEMNDLVRKAVQGRNNTAETCLQHMQTLSRIESLLSKVYADIKGLDMPADDQAAFNTLNIVSRLPYVYGSLLIEAVRRREWIDKMKRDSSTLAEEMATYQEEESRRRQRWLNSIDDVVRPELAKSKALGIEVNLQSEPEQWPLVTRQEIEEYIDQLARLGYPEEVTQELMNALRTLDQPTRKQVKHAKAFRNGSMHEAAFGTTSLALRGEDDFKVLRDANAKLEEEVRGQKSRVRKLEDLLHRQTTINRAVSGDVFTPQLDLVSRPDSPNYGMRRISEDMRPASSRSRRTSSNQGGEEKRLARRLVMLEAELQSQREQKEALERDVRERQEVHEKGKAEILEAESVKKDIMENMEAQQREFATERRGLEEELAGAKGRIEELEDEFDRLLGSRDNEKSGVENRVRDLENELRQARDEVKKTGTEKTRNVEEMRQNWLAEQERSKVLEEQLRDAMAAKEHVESSVKRMQATAEEQRQVEQEHLTTLSNAHMHLSPGAEAPAKYTNLVSALEDLARRSASHVKDLAEAVAVAKSENESLLSQHQAQTAELTQTRKQQSDVEDELARAREQVSSEAAKAESLASQLDAEREQLKLLRSKFAEGETGAGALRQRVEEQDLEVSRLSERLAEANSHVNSLDVELMRVQNKLNAATSAAESAQSRLDVRSARAKDLSQRIFAQNARLLRLLESLGFAVSHKDGAMIIERASKVGASTTLTEPSTILQRTASLASPPTSRKPSAAIVPSSSSPPSPTSLSFLHWPDASDPAIESNLYTALRDQLALFNTDTFAEALSKRLRDFEYTARKFRLEARTASSRATKYLHEASTKLAVRDFKEGDLALFLPTKGKAVGAWAAFNINSPHHFLREKEGMGLAKREWLVARITRVEERVVDLGRSLRSTGVEADNLSSRSFKVDGEERSKGDREREEWLESENPFDLSDGLTWYLVHAQEERAGAPTTPGLGKVTVQGSLESAKAERGKGKVEDGKGVKDLKEKLGKSLESRRSSGASRRSNSASVKGVPIPGAAGIASPKVDQGGLSISPARQSELGKSPQSGKGQGVGLISAKVREQSERSEQDKTQLAVPDAAHSSSAQQEANADSLAAPPVATQERHSPELPPETDPVDDAMASAMASSMRLRTPVKQGATSTYPAASPTSGPASGQTRESKSIRALRSNLTSPSKASPSASSARKLKGERSVGSLRREAEGGGGLGIDEGVESPTRGPGHRKKGSTAGWRSLWSVDYGIEGGGPP
ncbi:putative autophagy-related protein 11 [Elsinoe australis]|uniref:Autophagy-related protein 11 n=1 Tax=Elsinoe australis TaxID=40998 RepID=A0A4U7B9U5_9PEZI|nr:putative autophagy-related protein 11 [Elsinoe australis]